VTAASDRDVGVVSRLESFQCSKGASSIIKYIIYIYVPMLEKTSNILLRSMIYVIYVVEEYVGSFLMQVSGSFAVSQNRFMS
jgi:hypothetical protein